MWPNGNFLNGRKNLPYSKDNVTIHQSNFVTSILGSTEHFKPKLLLWTMVKLPSDVNCCHLDSFCFDKFPKFIHYTRIIIGTYLLEFISRTRFVKLLSICQLVFFTHLFRENIFQFNAFVLNESSYYWSKCIKFFWRNLISYDFWLQGVFLLQFFRNCVVQNAEINQRSYFRECAE